MIRLLMKKQSDLSLCCFSRPFWQETSVCNFRIIILLVLCQKSVKLMSSICSYNNQNDLLHNDLLRRLVLVGSCVQ